ncbi:Chromosome partition protein Smc [Diplonema papillatum]|nr:Chromosome partition protein Smc [Diplonema papillatum]
MRGCYLQSVYISGFKSFSPDRPQRFELCCGVNVVVGANGAGKSNVVDAIMFALTASERDLRVVKMRQLLHAEGAKQAKCAVVELCFAFDGEAGDRADRQPTTLSASLFKDADDRRFRVGGVRKTLGETRAWLASAVGLCLAVPSSFAVLQNGVIGLAQRTPAQLASLVTQATGTAALRLAFHECSAFLSQAYPGAARSISAGIEGLRADVDALRQKLSTLLSINSLNARIATLQEQRFVLAKACTVVDVSRRRAEHEGRRADLAAAVSRACRSSQEELVAKKALEEARDAEKECRVTSVEPLLGASVEAKQAASDADEDWKAAEASRRSVEESIAAASEDRLRLLGEKRRLEEQRAPARDNVHLLRSTLRRLSLEDQLPAVDEDALRQKVAKAAEEARRTTAACEEAGRAVAEATERHCALRASCEAAARAEEEAAARYGSDRKEKDQLARVVAQEAALRGAEALANRADVALSAYARLDGSVGRGTVAENFDPTPACARWAAALQAVVSGRWGVELCSRVADAKALLATAQAQGRAVQVWCLPELPPCGPSALDPPKPVADAVRAAGGVLPHELWTFPSDMRRAAQRLIPGHFVFAPAEAFAELFPLCRRHRVTLVTEDGCVHHAAGDRVTGGWADAEKNAAALKLALAAARARCDAERAGLAALQSEQSALVDTRVAAKTAARHAQSAASDLRAAARLLRAAGKANDAAGSAHRTLRAELEAWQKAADLTSPAPGAAGAPRGQDVSAAVAADLERAEAALRQLDEALSETDMHLSIIGGGDDEEDAAAATPPKQAAAKRTTLATAKQELLHFEQKVTQLQSQVLEAAAKHAAAAAAFAAAEQQLAELQGAARAAGERARAAAAAAERDAKAAEAASAAEVAARAELERALRERGKHVIPEGAVGGAGLVADAARVAALLLQQGDAAGAAAGAGGGVGPLLHALRAAERGVPLACGTASTPAETGGSNPSVSGQQARTPAEAGVAEPSVTGQQARTFTGAGAAEPSVTGPLRRTCVTARTIGVADPSVTGQQARTPAEAGVAEPSVSSPQLRTSERAASLARDAAGNAPGTTSEASLADPSVAGPLLAALRAAEKAASLACDTARADLVALTECSGGAKKSRRQQPQRAAAADAAGELHRLETLEASLRSKEDRQRVLDAWHLEASRFVENSAGHHREADDADRKALALCNERFQEFLKGRLAHQQACILPVEQAARPDAEGGAGYLSRGIEVRIDGNSLSLYSGGQRTIIALCLLLSISHLRAAPLYLLDEVDAALDESNQASIASLVSAALAQRQVICITHHPSFRKFADKIFTLQNHHGASVLSSTSTALTLPPADGARASKRSRLA